MRNIIKQTHIFNFVFFLLPLCLFIQIETTVAQSANELIARAKISIEKKEYASAITDLTAAIKADANSADAFLQRAFVFSLQALKHLSAFTSNLSINLEPVYGIILAVLIFKENTELNFEFYLGTLIILSCVVLHPLLQKYEKRKLNEYR